jgi:cell division protein FtsQ
MVLGLIGFVEKKESEKYVKNTIINIKDEYGSHFIDRLDIEKIITSNYTDNVRGKEYDAVSLKNLERKIKSNKFVDDAQVYRDHKGNILIDITQSRPIARIVQSNGPHAYISDKGEILPVSDKFTARVVIIDGDKAGKFLDTAYINSKEAKDFISMLHVLEKDPFLKAQVSQITFTRNAEIEFRPQVGDETILLGKLDDIEAKLNKVKIFYKKIIQVKGYSKYKVVNLKYKEQIICE